MKKSIFMGYFCLYFGRLVYYGQKEFFCVLFVANESTLTLPGLSFLKKARSEKPFCISEMFVHFT